MKEYFVWLAKLITVLILFSFFFFVIVGVGAKLADEVTAVSTTSGSNKVGVVDLTGMITDVAEVLKHLQEFSNDNSIKGIVLRIDSPGGAVGPSQEVFNAVKRLKAKKAIVTSMGAVAASGGLYSALSSNKIFAQPGTLTASIGVIMQIPNFAALADKVGFTMVTIKSGGLKDTGNTFRPMSDAEREYLEKTAHSVHQQFIRDVAASRNLSEEKVKEFADGRVLTGEDALKVGLIDGFGDIYDAAKAALEIAGVVGEEPVLVYPPKKFGQLKELFENTTKLVNSFKPITSTQLLFLYQ